MLSGRQMATREHADVDAERRQPLARGDDLSRLERVLFTARDVEDDRVPQFTNNRPEIPPLCVAAMLVQEPRATVQERGAPAAQDRVAQAGELGGGHRI